MQYFVPSIEFKDCGIFFSVTLALTAIQATIGNYVEPRLIGTTLNFIPFVIILSPYWGGIWGVCRMFLSESNTVGIAIVFSTFAPTHRVAVLLFSNGRSAG